MGDSSSSLSSSSPTPYYPQYEEWGTLPPKFIDLKRLHVGEHGKILKCLDLETRDIVVIKMAVNDHDLSKEASMLKLLMEHNLGKKNVVEYYHYISTYELLVFEKLDKNLMEYLEEREEPMRLQDIRIVIRQLATTLESLRNIGVIHTDLRPDNIMFVDQVCKPFKVKVVDFGMAIRTSDAPNTMIRRTPSFKAPELIMALPYSEAVDVWSLGCVMAMMVFGFPLFPGSIDYETLSYIIDIMGLPPDHLINAARKATVYFKMTESKQWIFKTRREDWEAMCDTPDKRNYEFRNLDATKAMRLENENVSEAEERSDCIELLKAMLCWDEKERITPTEILAHPFITRTYPGSTSHINTTTETRSESPQPSTSTQEPQRLRSRYRTAQPSAGSVRLPSVHAVVRPPPDNRRPLEEASDKESDTEGETLAPKGAESDCSLPAAPGAAVDIGDDDADDQSDDQSDDDTGDLSDNDADDEMDDHSDDEAENSLQVNSENNTHHDTDNDTEDDTENDIQNNKNNTHNNTQHDTHSDTDDDKLDDTENDIQNNKNDTHSDTEDDTHSDTEDYTEDDTHSDTEDDTHNDTDDDTQDDTDDDSDDDTHDDTHDDIEDDTLGPSESRTQHSEPKRKKKKTRVRRFFSCCRKSDDP